MINLINTWAHGLIVAVIISVIIEMILPEGNNKKYVKIVLSMYILFTIIYPLVNRFKTRNININSIIENTNKEMQKYKINSSVIETNAYIEKSYKNNLENNITNILEEKGYKVLNLKVEIETKKNEKYAQINSMAINIKKKIQDNNVNAIEEVKINRLNNKNENKNNENVSDDEIKLIKDFLENSYSVEQEKIHINE